MSTRYLHVYLNPAGQWSGKVLEEVAGIAGCAHPAEVMEAALERFPNIEDLPQSAQEPGGSVEAIEVNGKARDLLANLAAEHGVDLRTYVEALANYAISCERRPGSWEANEAFDFGNYDARLDVVADTWF